MLIPPQLRPGVVAPPRPSHPPVIRYRIRGLIVLLRVLMLCFHTAALADKALPPPPASPNFLDAVAADYANSQLFHAVEGIAPVRPERATPGDRAAPAESASQATPRTPLTPPPASLRRVNAR
ncbi:hypothetical protein [Cupriavidus agavae]|uniref:Uncharacterized protein n=1 Tax=Cupriavidus agavae TaxID=1001822 RepID=A0A4Q7S020_9BURK|nr:hypothetical protein [Cupriavidus agavae]RZT39486.1 hypothetical protein EV147_2681 [Cupriavidus agavae]